MYGRENIESHFQEVVSQLGECTVLKKMQTKLKGEDCEETLEISSEKLKNEEAINSLNPFKMGS